MNDQNTETLRAGVDTFAAANLISLELAKRLRIPQREPVKKLCAAEGAELQVISEGDIRIFLGSRIIDTKVYIVPRLHIPDMQILLGIPFHRKFGAKLSVDYEQHTVNYGGVIGKFDNVVGLVTEKALNGLVRREKDFDLYRSASGGWSFRWRWCVNEPRLPAHVPTIYKKRFFTQEILDTALNELQQWVDESFLRYIGPRSQFPDRCHVPLNLVLQPRKTTPVRVTLDLKALNRLVQHTEEQSKNEICSESLLEFRRVEQAYLLDVRRAYLQVRIEDPEQRKFLTIQIGEDLYEMGVLPFGLNIGPKVLYCILDEVLHGCKGFAAWYRDDVLVSDVHRVAEVEKLLLQNGFETKPPEEISPRMSQEVKVLGLTVYSDQGVVMWKREPKEPGHWDVRNQTVREVVSWISRVCHAPVAGWLRPIAAAIKSLAGSLAAESGWESVVPEGELWTLTKWAEAQLRISNPMKGRWKIPGSESQVHLYCDASEAFLGVLLAVGSEDERYPIYDNCRRTRGCHQINILELDSLIWGLQICLDHSFTNIEIHCDSRTVIGWIRKILEDKNAKISGLYSKLVERRLQIIAAMMDDFDLKLQILYIPTHENPADVLTRLPKGKESVVGAVVNPFCSIPKTLAIMQRENPSVEVLVKSGHEELIHPPVGKLLRALESIGIEITRDVKDLAESLARKCSSCALKKARIGPPEQIVQAAHSDDELFIDAFKCNGPGEFAGFVSYVDAKTRAASVEFFTGHVNRDVVERGLLRFFSLYWIPKIIRVDNGREFAGLEDFVADYGVRIVRGSVAHPQSQGLVERFHRTILSLIRLQNSDEDWSRRTQRALYTYMRSPHKGLNGLSPLQAVTQVLSNSRLINVTSSLNLTDEDHSEVAEENEDLLSITDSPVQNDQGEEQQQDLEAEPEMVSAEESRAQTPEDRFQVGQRVLWSDPNSIRRKDLPTLKRGTVTESKGLGAYMVRFDEPPGGGRVVTRQVNAARLAEDTTQEAQESPEETVLSDSQVELRRSSRNRRVPERYRSNS